MDLRQYFRKLRDIEAGIGDVYPLIVSLETQDGGKAGVVAEVPRAAAAKMIAEGRAVLASEPEKQLFREQQAATREAAENAELSRRIQVAVMTDPDFQATVAGRRRNSEPSLRGK